ncbi:helix-turn-helix transcriptional regulator [Actinophytocola gossypii]|uniref:Helix-turn-helix transcriptional regulator n=1 Tax=Actinophytocola gossypii TaxID=2812003 RepID=A0ABT2J6Z6_9PSEU|nr:helix-turn-helix transcriptional regulator [Actinophytocola gossypii]MCT2583632.1 helix-turn-helix transcriptional regulator [Actinophytocola gossypii]
MAPVAVDDVADALASAEREVLVMGTARDTLGLARRVVPRDGVRFRFVYPGHVRRSTATEAHLAALIASGGLVRTALRVPADVLVVDNALAFFPGRHAVRGEVVGVGLASIVATVVELFERTWAGGEPFDAQGLDVREQEVLRGLSSGWLDETVAARLGVSVRTVRREVAVLMHRLDARSRFQAGMRAAARGWLAP